jgi:hypothetical protein
VSAVVNPANNGPVLFDDISDFFAMSGETISKPSGPYAGTMLGPGAWPEFDESVFDQRRDMLAGMRVVVALSRMGWDTTHANIFNGELVWVGDGATAAGSKSQQHSESMQQIEQQLADAMEWCGTAFATTRMAKKAIFDFVKLKFKEITDLLDKANENGQDASDKAQEIADQAYLANKQFLAGLAAGLSGQTEAGASSSPDSAAAAPLDNGTGPAGSSESDGETSGPGGQPSASLMSGQAQEKSEGDDKASTGAEDGPVLADGLGNQSESVADPSAGAGDSVLGPVTDGPVVDGVGTQTESVADPSAGAEDSVLGPVTDGPVVDSVGTQTESAAGPPAFVAPGVTQPGTGTKAPTTSVPTVSAPSAPSAPSASGAGGGSGASGGGSGSPSGGSPSSASPGAGVDPSKAGGPDLGGRADPLQDFSKGFADSSGTPVHAASSGAPPPLAPSPTVPAGDTAPASAGSAPVAQSSAPAPTAPVQASPSGGGMGMGGGMPMGSSPLGPPPTAPPAGPVPPSVAVPPAAAAPASVAGGAQIAPIPVSAARAERDAAQNAAKRSSDPLVLARRIAAALNAPDMLNVEDYDFYWITALTAEGQIVVANNYGLAYLPAQVRLPEQVKLVSADESIPASERASFATYPMVAVQRWAQHHDTTLRAVIGGEEHLAKSDAGAHKVVLTPEDIPAKGQMAGRDRLQVIAPQIAMRLAGFSDADLINILPSASADTSPPEDRRTTLWEEVWEPLCSSANDRGQVHLQAFLAYAIHAQEWAVYEAHAAADGPDQRRAAADFIYWQHVGQLIADGLDA